MKDISSELKAEIRSLALQTETAMGKLEIAQKELARVERKTADLREEIMVSTRLLNELSALRDKGRTEIEEQTSQAMKNNSELETLGARLTQKQSELNALHMEYDARKEVVEKSIVLLKQEEAGLTSTLLALKADIDKAKSELSTEGEALTALKKERQTFLDECVAKDTEKSNAEMKREEELVAREVECGKREERVEVKRQTLLSYKKDLELYYNRSFPNLHI